MRKLFALAVVLALVPTACGSGSVPQGESAPSGVRGRVLTGPNCPVERADARCPDLPTSLRILILQDDVEVGSVRSDADGRFEMDLAPGTYRLVPDLPSGGGPPSARPVTVTIEPARYARVTVYVDTGIR